jgi:LuxR family maltose regulon positive regulatory protein
MNGSLLVTKIFVPVPRVKAVKRAKLCRCLNENLLCGEVFSRKLTLVSAPAGFGKTSVVSEWLTGLPVGKAWLSLDEKDSDPVRFLAYLVSALQTALPDLGAWVLSALLIPQPPSLDTLLTRLVNDLVGSTTALVLVLDDYHALNSPSIDEMLSFLIDNLPAQVHIVLITREDPGLPLARYRARGQMRELRAKDLTFSIAEVEAFFRDVMGISLPESDLTALEARTEGWAAGLQCAALALQGLREKEERAAFIASFTGSHRFVFDYLVDEVLLQQSGEVQIFLMATSCLSRFCGELCDAVLDSPLGTGRASLKALDRANLFLVPLDGERSWYRYQQLFAEILQQRLFTSPSPSCPDSSLVHARASLWFERNDFIVEAFRHAAASGDFARAEALIEDRRMPSHTREVMMEVIGWLDALPESVKNERPSLWVKSATFPLVAGITAGMEERLQAAELALRGKEDSERLLFGQISTARATLAISSYHIEDAKIHARRALELLADRDFSFRLAALWDLGMAYHFAGDRIEARRILEQVLSDSRSAGAVNFQIISALALGELEEGDNRLFLAAETFRRVLELSGEHPQPNICVAYQGLARIHYEWNDLEKAGIYGEQGLVLARQYDSAIDRFLSCEVFLAKLELGKGNLDSAEEGLTLAKQNALKNRFLHRIPEIQAAQSLLRLKKGSIPEPEGLPPPVRIRILLAKGQFDEAAGLLDSWILEIQDREDDRLRALVLCALVQESSGNHKAACDTLESALKLAEPGGFVRLFVDEGQPMHALILAVQERGEFLDGSLRIYVNRILAAFPAEPADKSHGLLSERELEVLNLIAEGLSNQDIAKNLFLSLHTVKVHARNIFAKLDVSSRTLAVAKARSLGLFLQV